MQPDGALPKHLLSTLPDGISKQQRSLPTPPTQMMESDPEVVHAELKLMNINADLILNTNNTMLLNK